MNVELIRARVRISYRRAWGPPVGPCSRQGFAVAISRLAMRRRMHIKTEHEMNQINSSPLHRKFVAWVILVPLFYFAVHGMFSFDRAQYVNNAGLANSNAVAASSDTLSYRLQRLTIYGML